MFVVCFIAVLDFGRLVCCPFDSLAILRKYFRNTKWNGYKMHLTAHSFCNISQDPMKQGNTDVPPNDVDPNGFERGRNSTGAKRGLSLSLSLGGRGIRGIDRPRIVSSPTQIRGWDGGRTPHLWGTDHPLEKTPNNWDKRKGTRPPPLEKISL